MGMGTVLTVLCKEFCHPVLGDVECIEPRGCSRGRGDCFQEQVVVSRVNAATPPTPAVITLVILRTNAHTRTRTATVRPSDHHVHTRPRTATVRQSDRQTIMCRVPAFVARWLSKQTRTPSLQSASGNYRPRSFARSAPRIGEAATSKV